MPLMRGFSRVDNKGSIRIPSNMRREANLRPGQLVEIKVQGNMNAEFITVKARKMAR